MANGTIGVAAMGGGARDVLAAIEDLERRGIGAAWLTTGGAGLDALTIFGAAAMTTERILLGTSIIPTWPRHPVAAVQQVQVLAELAPGRFRFGVGPSHRPAMTQVFGVDFDSPLTNLREYLTIAKSLLRDGSVRFEGEHYRTEATIPAPAPDVPVMASALRPNAYELCGELADGAISWVCPAEYLRDVGLPALARGAARAGRPAPPLVAHVPLCVHDDADEARAAFHEQFGRYPTLPFYNRMLQAAGFAEAADGRWSDAMIASVMVAGDEEAVATRIRELFDWGIAEVLVSVVTAGSDAARSRERTLSLVSSLTS